MTVHRFKPVVSAGFSFFLSVSAVHAQDYIDVEAERRSSGQQSGEPPVISVQRNDKPASPATAPQSGVGQSPSGSSGDYAVPGIRPYSGQTTTVTPIESSGNRTGGSGGQNIGSLVIQLQQLQEEVRRLNGIVEEQSEQIQRLNEQSLERYVELDRRVAAMGGAAGSSDAANGASTGNRPAATGGQGNGASLSFGGVSSAGGGATSSPATNSPANTGAAGVEAQPGEESAYQAAYELVKAREFDQAVEAFRGFLTDYPFGRYAPNAHYWLGELYLVTDPPDPELARQSFKLLLDQYPDNTKVPDALYKLGRVHFLKGNRDRSREYLNRVISTYAGHPAAQLAQDFLNQNF